LSVNAADVRERAPVFVVMPFDPEFTAIYSTIRDTVAEKGLQAARADDIKISAPFMENVFNAIEQAGLVIGITSHSNANVTYELGYARHLNKETILLTDDPNNIPSDLSELNHLVYSPADLPLLAAQLAEWLESSRFLASERSRGVLRRGEVFEEVVDGTFYLQKSRPIPSKTEIKQFLTKRTTMPQRLLYLTEEGQATYLTLCEDPHYDYYHETVKYVVERRKDLVDGILEHCGSSEVDFISLGPGNGHKDAVFLQELLRRARSARYTYYYPYDVSGGLLLESLRTILARDLPVERLRVKAIEADIASLAEFKRVFDFREEPNIYSLLGGLDNTGNEVALLTLLHQLMNPDDCLLIEIRKKAGTGPQALGTIELNRRLDLAPLRYIGAEVDPNTVDYKEVASTSSIHNTRTIAATVPRLRLTNKTYENLSLFSVHYYEDSEIRAHMEGRLSRGSVDRPGVRRGSA
jgi:Histidine-specific methyltransferase, SAM-dependent